MNSIRLEQDERVLYEGSPLHAVVSYWIFVSITVFFIFLGLPFLFIFIAILIDENISTLTFFILVILTILTLFIFILITGFLAESAYKKRYYMITNKRVIYKRGIFGYQISSVPFNRISDVIISRTFLEQLFGFGSIKIQTLAGQFSGGRGGSEIDFAAVENPEQIQLLISQQLKKDKEKLL